MSAKSRAIADPARPNPPSSPLQLAAMEVARDIWSMVGEEHRENFVVIGGAALLLRGSSIPMSDTDIAITGDSLSKFEELVKEDEQFFQPFARAWVYKPPRGFNVPTDFLNNLGRGGFRPWVQSAFDHGRMPVATLANLALSKGAHWVNSKKTKDFDGFEYAVRKMANKGFYFRGLDEEGREILDDIKEKLQQVERGSRFLRVIRVLL